jgi:peptidoglycan hydrolase-like protein with peptidoglycan-binding domain
MTKVLNFQKISVRFLLGVGLVLAAFLIMGSVSIARADTLNRDLSIGMSGADVSALQTFLAQDNTIYPQGLVTGYFGILTQAAVSNFQSRNGIEAVGQVGPITLPVLNLQIANGMVLGSSAVSSVSAPMITSVTTVSYTNSVSVAWNTNEFARGTVYYSTSPLTTYENNNSVNVSGNTAMTDTNFKSSQNVSIAGLSANTTYYYMIYTTDQQGNVSVTWPSTFQTTN